ncbi:MAG: hypothetical protein K0U52_00990 [Gammaproteobacteria bacterium]|nr:hypothetical protein [Gammaproteobacteria bacterium]
MQAIYTTLTSMLERRGYDVGPMLNKTMEELGDAFVLTKPQDEDDTIVVFVDDDPNKLGKARIRDYFIEEMLSMEVHRAILVIVQGMTNPAVQYLMELPELVGVRIDPFTYNDLKFDRMAHHKVPNHRLLTNQEKMDKLKELRVKADQLMVLQLRDPIAQYLGLQIGDVVEIERHTPTGICKVYRCVQDSDIGQKAK